MQPKTYSTEVKPTKDLMPFRRHILVMFMIHARQSLKMDCTSSIFAWFRIVESLLMFDRPGMMDDV